MKTKSFFPSWEQIKTTLWNLFLITAGCCLVAAAVNGILLPRRFVSGGFLGAAMNIHYLTPALGLPALLVLLNVPVFLLGWRMVGRRFFAYSLFGAVALAAAVEYVHLQIPVSDKILAALLAGIIAGGGMGLVMRSLGSVGGASILSVILFRRWSIRPGATALAFNVLVLAAAVYTASLDAALYTLIYMFVNAKVMDVVMTGLSQRKAVFIISPHWEQISRGILSELRRGATVIPARGAYTGQEEHILYSVVSIQNLGRLKDLVRRADPGAFVVVSDTLEVMGRRIGNQPRW